jgi:hypothetical protein
MMKKTFALRALIPCIAALLLFALAAAVQSAPEIVSLEIGPGAMTCNSTAFNGSYAVYARDSSGQPVGGSFNVLRTYRTSSGNRTQAATQTNGEVITFLIDLPGSPLTWTSVEVILADNPAVSSGSVTVLCDTNTILLPSSGDSRLNPGAGDLEAVLYRGYDRAGQPAIDVYRVDGSRGLFHGRYSYSLFAPYLGNAPTQNTWIASDGLTDLYALSSGEFQINIRTRDGKRYRVIFSGMPARVISAGEE